MTDDHDDILDDLFHGCAWAAYLDQAAEQRGWPDSAATKRRAYRYGSSPNRVGRNSPVRASKPFGFRGFLLLLGVRNPE
jgi:hypothetical protein